MQFATHNCRTTQRFDLVGLPNYKPSMTDGSPSLPPARARTRSEPTVPPGSEAEPQTDLAPVGPIDVEEHLLGQGPRQYLLHGEDVAAFDGLVSAIETEVRPNDPIERIWTDEFIGLEWDLHRLRTTRRAVVEAAMVAQIVDQAVRAQIRAGGGQMSENHQALIRGSAIALVHGHQDPTIVEDLGTVNLPTVLRTAQEQTLDTCLRIDAALQAGSRQRDALLSRLYGRRDALAEGRITRRRST